MKKLLYLFMTCILFISCEKETADDEIITDKSSITKAPCTIDSPECGSKNSTVVFTYESAVHNRNITWSVVNGNMSLISGQGTRNAVFRLASNFTGGTVNVRAGGCSLSKQIALCSSPPPCGLSISRVYEFNGNQEHEVAFGTVPTLASRWAITSSLFSVTYESNSVANYVGSLNPNGYPQILIPVYCTDRVKKVTATVTSSYGSRTCTKTITTNFSSPVCGTGGGFGDF